MRRLRRRLAKWLAPWIGTELAPYIKREIDSRIAVAMAEAAQRLEPAGWSDTIVAVNQRLENLQNKQLSFYTHQFYQPNPIVAGSIPGEYMRASNALARDFFHPDFAEFCRLIGTPMGLHRKLWEFAFIYEHLKRAGVLVPGRRGLVFGVGLEMLPSLFARMGVAITATDAPADDNGWGPSQARSADQLFYPNLVDREVFDRQVRFEPCDMNDIPAQLRDYDFCWSSCAFEHLGSIQNGLDFVITSVEKTLKVGGVACHTTELNLTSDEDTIESAGFSLYRKKDLERLCAALTERGHRVEPLRIEPGDLTPDYLVDAPPYHQHLHLKLLVENSPYITTSVGIVARRGR